MAIFTRAEKNRQIALWQEALEKVSRGQEYTIGSRRLRRADLPEIRSTLDWLRAPWKTKRPGTATRVSCRPCRAAAAGGASDA